MIMGLNLALQEEGFADAENHEWLGSQHGTENPESGTLDDDAWLAIFDSGVVPSGVVLMVKGGGGSDADLLVPRIAAGAGALADATAEQWDLDLDDATSCIFEVAGENVSIAAADTAAQAKTKLLALAVFEDYTTSSITATKPTGTTFRFVFPAGDEIPNPQVGAATGGSTPTVLATVTTEGSPAADGNVGAMRGHLLNQSAIHAGGQTPISVLWHGKVKVANLPDDSGWDSDVPAEFPSIRYQV